MIDNLQSTTLLLENQDILLETVLSKKVYDIIDHLKVKKLSNKEFVLHSTSCNGKSSYNPKCQDYRKVNSRIRNKLRENHLLNLSLFLILILKLV